MTPTLRESYAEGTTTSCPRWCSVRAARASLRLLAAGADEDGGLPIRRAVLVADAEAKPGPILMMRW